MPKMSMTVDNIPGSSNQKNNKNKSLTEQPPAPPPQPIFRKKPVRPVIDKAVLAAFLNQTSDEEKKELIQEKPDCSGKLWTKCAYCQVYLKVSNLEKHLKKCCAKLGMIIKK